MTDDRPRNSSARTWCGTWNNPPEALPQDALLAALLPLSVRYLVSQLEAGDNDTRHLQFYIEFKRTVRFTRLKKALPDAHLEQRRGSRQQARDYCMKDDTRIDGPWEHGEFRNAQGKRTDLEDLYRDIRADKPLVEIYDAHPAAAIRYNRGIHKVRSDLASGARDTPPQVTLLYGPPDCGKTRLAYEENPGLWSIPLQNTRTMWFDTYDRHPRVLLDDFAGAASHATLAATLRLIDRYPLLVPYKGGFTHWTPEHITLTTNIHPRSWWDYSNREMQYRALARRFTALVVWPAEPSSGFDYIVLDRPDCTDDDSRPDNDALWKRFWAFDPTATVRTDGPLDLYSVLSRENEYDFMFM